MGDGKAGIIGYGVYIPIERITTEAIVKKREKHRKDLRALLDKVRNGLLLRYKSVASATEDPITIATEAADNAIKMAQIEPSMIEAVAAGSESKPYAVGTIARHVASFVGVGTNAYVADLEGACNAGMQGLVFIEAQVSSYRIEYGLALGTDVAQASEGDPLEYACGAGAGAFVIGRDDPIATIEDTAGYSSLTMDFWRRDGSPAPRHFGKTTVEAYISHVIGAIELLLKKHPELRLSDFDYVTFHQPSGYVPLKTCKVLAQEKIEYLSDRSLQDRIRIDSDFIEKKVKPWLRVLDTGNTYSASTPIALCDILDHAKPGEDILAVSYGSGAYTIATWLKVQDSIEKKRGMTPTVQQYIDRRIDLQLRTYEDLLRERFRKFKRQLGFSRIVGEIEPLTNEALRVTLCQGCERVYYPARAKCLEFECSGQTEQILMPKRARLNSFRKLPIRKKLISSYEIFKSGRVLLVDSRLKDLSAGMEMEAVIRRLEYEGKDGLILYGPAYRPAFTSRIYQALRS
jgi:hydroxymethylglutaryl-CoA synthase